MRPVELVVRFPADVVDDGLVVVQTVPHLVEVVVGDGAGERAETLRVGAFHAVRLAHVVVVQDGDVDVLVIGVELIEAVLEDRAAGLNVALVPRLGSAPDGKPLVPLANSSSDTLLDCSASLVNVPTPTAAQFAAALRDQLMEMPLEAADASPPPLMTWICSSVEV